MRNAGELPSARILATMTSDFDNSYVSFTRAQSELARSALSKLPLPVDREAYFQGLAQQSFEEQKRIEAADTMPFEAFLKKIEEQAPLRVPGTAVYESTAFWDACDRLGILVWQDAMLATLDPSDDDAMQHELAAELEEVLRPLQMMLCIPAEGSLSRVGEVAQARMSHTGIERAPTRLRRTLESEAALARWLG